MYGYFENNLPIWWVYIKNTILCVVDSFFSFPLWQSRRHPQSHRRRKSLPTVLV